MGRRIIEDYGVADVIDALDPDSQTLRINIANQEVTVANELRSLEEAYPVIALNQFVDATSYWESAVLDMVGFTRGIFLFSVSTAGTCTVTFETSCDGDNWFPKPFRVNGGTTLVTSQDLSSGETEIEVDFVARYLKVKVQADGTNSTTFSLLCGKKLA